MYLYLLKLSDYLNRAHFESNAVSRDLGKIHVYARSERKNLFAEIYSQNTFTLLYDVIQSSRCAFRGNQPRTPLPRKIGPSFTSHRETDIPSPEYQYQYQYQYQCRLQHHCQRQQINRHYPSILMLNHQESFNHAGTKKENS